MKTLKRLITTIAIAAIVTLPLANVVVSSNDAHTATPLWILDEEIVEDF